MGTNSIIVVIDDVVLFLSLASMKTGYNFALIFNGGREVGVTEQETIGFVIQNKNYSPRWKLETREPLPDFMNYYNIFFLP